MFDEPKSYHTDELGEYEYKLENKRMSLQAWAYGGLLSVVLILNLSPLFVSLYKRPDSDIINKLGENSLILTSAVANLASFVFGMTVQKNVAGKGSASTSKGINERNGSYPIVKHSASKQKDIDAKEEVPKEHTV